jgi:ankyrin repeat protein
MLKSLINSPVLSQFFIDEVTELIKQRRSVDDGGYLKTLARAVLGVNETLTDWCVRLHQPGDDRPLINIFCTYRDVKYEHVCSLLFASEKYHTNKAFLDDLLVFSVSPRGDEDYTVLRAVPLLLRLGADPNAGDGIERAIHWTAIQGNVKTTLLLIKAGVNLNITNSDNQTPLFKAGFWGQSDQIAQLLIENKADVNASDLNGRTPLISAIVAYNISVAEVLILNGADVNTVETMQSSSENNFEWRTPLYYAAKRDLTDLVKLLLEYGADKDLIIEQFEDGRSTTAIDYAKEETREVIRKFPSKHVISL